MQFHSHNHIIQAPSTEALITSFQEVKRVLTLQFDDSELVVSINKMLVPPISWFLTNELGEFITMGQVSDQSFKINLAGLTPGTYSLRIAGEVIIINHKA